MRIYLACDRGMAGVQWPDGGAYLDQPCALVTAWAVIGNALHRFRKRK